MNQDTITAARIAMMRAKAAAESAAHYVENLTGVRMVGVDETHFGQETRLMSQAAAALRAIPVGDRPEIAVAALEALEAWEDARGLYDAVDADPEGMVQVWAAEERAVAAYYRVEGLAG